MSPRTLKALLLLSLVACAALAAAAAEEEAEAGEVADDDYQEAERGFLVVRKFFATGKEDEWGVQGRNLTVTVDVYNAGTVTAKDVYLKDGELPEGFALLEGALEGSLGKIEPGSSAQHKYVVVPSKGSFGLRLKPAQVTYVAEIDSTDRQIAYSSTAGIYVYTPVEQLQYYILVAGRYVTLGLVQTPAGWRNLGLLVLVVGTLVGGNTAASRMKASRTERNRARALQELEKSN